ncbi:MAG: imidazoleglycerol-phosphate dehydratase HisB [Halanaerobiales bacterium]
MVEIERKTGETEIELWLEIYGDGDYSIDTGVGFFDHMLELFSRHGFFNLELAVNGDLEVDAHHTVEDTGIAMGQALKRAVGEKKGIRRYGQVILPMDEVLVLCALDLSGRPYYDAELEFNSRRVGDFSVELVDEFFRSFSTRGEFNLHFKLLKGGNTHHVIEACFKACAQALDNALQAEKRTSGKPLSTKGSLREGDNK